jgi:hypothetical protein
MARHERADSITRRDLITGRPEQVAGLPVAGNGVAAIEHDGDERLHAQVTGSDEGHRVMADIGDVCPSQGGGRPRRLRPVASYDSDEHRKYPPARPGG